ncbi:MAG TPA: transglycosylase SLT domain-containing protein [Rhodospirillales bacterium]
MKTIIRLFILCAAAMAASGAVPARANPVERLDNAGTICAEQTAAMERQTGIPRHLLTAISLAESGRWSGASRANVAWPWTVTAEGRGRFFDSREEAQAEVEILLTQGVRNIDVGCMQVNLQYHGGAFDSLAEAFDPHANTAYAATYLKAMYQTTGNWMQAAGYYHSTTPERNGPYMQKVLGFWRQQAGGIVAQRLPGETVAEGPVPVDYARMTRLNAGFKARRDGGRPVAGKHPGVEDLEATRARELDAWRDATQRGAGVAHLAAMRQAELELKRRRAVEQLERADSETGFTDRRLKQLRHWRSRVAGNEPAPAAEATPAAFSGAAAGWTAAIEPVSGR